MHEVGLALEVLDIARARCEGARVRRVVVEVGALVAVDPEALRFAFEAAASGSALEGAALEVVTRPGRARCRTCGASVDVALSLAVDHPHAVAIGACPCGACDLAWESGRELLVRELEVE